MRNYKGWTANERLASFKKTKAAIAAGTIPPPTKCNRCGKVTGRIDYHNHDYSDPIKYLEQICQGCHTRLHRLENKDLDGKNRTEQVSPDIRKADAQNSVSEESKAIISNGEKAAMDGVVTATEIEKKSKHTSSDLNSWLKKGMELPFDYLADHIRTTPVGIKPLHALRGLGIVFSNGFTKLYNCEGYPQAVGLGKNRQKFDIVVERVLFYERNGESMKIKGMSLSDKLKSNFTYNK